MFEDVWRCLILKDSHAIVPCRSISFHVVPLVCSCFLRRVQVSHLPDILDANAPKEAIGKVQSIVQELLVIQGEEDGKDPA